MPAKIRKKSETGGLNQPDQVMTGLTKTYGFLDKYKVHIVSGFAAVVALLLVISWFVDYRESTGNEQAQAFFEAFKNYEAVVGLDIPVPNGVPKFATDEEKFTKLAEDMQAFLDDNSSADIADTARLVLASAKMELGKYEEAYGLLDAYLEELPGSALIPLVHENLGYASLHLGKMEQAVDHFNKMKEASANPYLKARALVHLGDLHNPGTSAHDGSKDAAKSKTFYEEALSLIPETEEEATLDPTLSLTRDEILLRLTLLGLG
jgi:tetratricopeptide (TPR) repeat protein